MLKKIAISAACGAAVVGVGTAALASSGDLSGSTGVTGLTAAAGPTTGSGSDSAASMLAAAVAPGTSGLSKLDKAKLLKRLGGVAHVSWVAKDDTGAYVTHNAIHGAVTAVSATSITVKAGDGVSQTYAVSPQTKIRVRTDGKGADATIAQVKTGQNAVVAGTGTTSLTATGIVAGLRQ